MNLSKQKKLDCVPGNRAFQPLYVMSQVSKRLGMSTMCGAKRSAQGLGPSTMSGELG